MKLYERFGRTAKQVDSAYEIEHIETNRALMREKPDDRWIWCSSLVSDYSLAALREYLRENNREARKYAEGVAHSLHEYFFGRWRNEVPTGNHGELPPDPVYQRQSRSWISDYRYGLLWCSVLGQWEELAKLSQYPGDDCPLEDIDCRPALKRLLLEIASCLKGEPRLGVSERVEKEAGASWRGQKEIAQVVDAILAKDEALASKLLTTYVKGHKKREPKYNDITATISIEATFLIHWAAHLGLSIGVPDELDYFIVRLPSA